MLHIFTLQLFIPLFSQKKREWEERRIRNDNWKKYHPDSQNVRMNEWASHKDDDPLF